MKVNLRKLHKLGFTVSFDGHKVESMMDLPAMVTIEPPRGNGPPLAELSKQGREYLAGLPVSDSDHDAIIDAVESAAWTQLTKALIIS